MELINFLGRFSITYGLQKKMLTNSGQCMMYRIYFIESWWLKVHKGFGCLQAILHVWHEAINTCAVVTCILSMMSNNVTQTIFKLYESARTLWDYDADEIAAIEWKVVQFSTCAFK